MENLRWNLTLHNIFDRIALGSHRRVTILLLVIGLISIQPIVRGYNDGSRMATIQALVEHHTFAIDDTDFMGGFDKVFINGHYYSDKPVIPALLGAVIYFPLYHLGITLGNGWNLAYYLITLLTVKLFWYWGIRAFYTILGMLRVDEKPRLLYTIALGIGSLYFSWSATYNNHALAAAFLIIGLQALLKAKSSQQPGRELFWAGLWISLAGMGDLAIMAFYAAFAVYLLWQPYALKAKFAYLLPLIFTMVPTFGVNFAISGRLIPFNLVHEYFIYPNSPWAAGRSLTGLNINVGRNLLIYTGKMFFGPKGFFLYNPLALLSLYYLVLEIKNKGKLWQEALPIGGATLIVMAFYLLMSNNLSGAAYSIRWFVPMLPLWYIFFYQMPGAENLKLQKAFLGLFILSTVIAVVGQIDPWTLTNTGVPFLDNLIVLFRIS